MVDIKVGQTIRIYASVWNFCGITQQSLYVHDVQINALPSTYPPSCLDISGIGISFSLGTTSSSTQCNTCSPDATYTNLGSANTDVNGVAYLDYTVTDHDYGAWQTAQAAGAFIRILACITNPKGQAILNHACSDAVTVIPTVSISPTYAVEFSVYENATGLLSFLSGHTPLVTSAINTLIPPGSGWIVDHTIVDVTNRKITIYLSDIGSWNIADIVAYMFGLIVAVVALVYVGVIGLTAGAIVLLVGGVIILSYKVYDLATANNILTHEVQNFETKDQNGTKRDQMIGQVEDLYQKSPKTVVDCQNRLNGLKISNDTYLDTMTKDFPAMFTAGTKRNFDTTADKAISDFNAGTITCDVAAGQIQSAGGIANSDVSTNFTNLYVTDNPYVAPKVNPAECWITGPLGDCWLTANTGWWIVGAGAFITIVGGAYYLATRHPKGVRSVIRSAKRTHKAIKKEVQTAGKAYQVIAKPVEA